MPDGSAWPRVSIVTPSLNQADFLEKTLRSVLLQGYPDLDYIVIDGGSTDGSVEIIRQYEPWLAYWVSEPDKGQAQAINKGLRKASGEIVAWLNSDDYYLPGAIHQAVLAMYQSQAAAVYSRCRIVTPEGNLLAIYDPEVPVTLRKLIMYWRYHYANPAQPTVFLKRQVLDVVGLLDETFHYALDYELWLRVIQHFDFTFADATWANYVVHAQSKTGRGWRPFADECYRAGRRHWRHLGLIDQAICRFGGYRLPMARRYVGHAFDAYAQGDRQQAKSWLWKAVCMDPSRLFNRGVLSLWRKVLGKHPADGAVTKNRLTGRS